jgi:protein-disulfide isomerase
MKNIPLLIGTIVGTFLLIVGIALLFSGQDQADQASSRVEPQVLMDNVRTYKGADPQAAQVVIVEFSDFQCPACKAAQPLVNQILAAYPDEVSLIYRHFTLDSIFPNSRWAAQAVEAAGSFDKFWKMHDLVFENQATWAVITDRQELRDTFGSYAEELLIDKDEFLEKIEDEVIQQNVAYDVELGRQVGISATPTFFVNGERVSAPQLFPAVDSLLANTNAQEETE